MVPASAVIAFSNPAVVVHKCSLLVNHANTLLDIFFKDVLFTLSCN